MYIHIVLIFVQPPIRLPRMTASHFEALRVDCLSVCTSSRAPPHLHLLFLTLLHYCRWQT